MSRKTTFLLMILTLLCASTRGAEPFTPAESLSYERCDTGIRITGLLDETLTQLNLPPEIDGLPVAEIGESAFVYCENLTSVTIPESVQEIGREAFYYCENLTSVTIPEGMTEIRFGVFVGCSGLTSVTIPEGVTVIEEDAFCGCLGLTAVTIPRSVQEIGESAFYDCAALTGIQCDPENPNYKSVDGVLFSKDGKTLVAFPAGFSGAYTLPEGVAAIGDSAFGSCEGLTSVTIPESVTVIRLSAFSVCTSLASVTIPASVTAIGGSAFRNCDNLTIHAPAGSAAERFAKENGIPFAAE